MREDSQEGQNLSSVTGVQQACLHPHDGLSRGLLPQGQVSEVSGDRSVVQTGGSGTSLERD